MPDFERLSTAARNLRIKGGQEPTLAALGLALEEAAKDLAVTQSVMATLVTRLDRGALIKDAASKFKGMPDARERFADDFKRRLDRLFPA